MRDSRHLVFCIASTVMIVFASGLFWLAVVRGREEQEVHQFRLRKRMRDDRSAEPFDKLRTGSRRACEARL